MKEWDFTADLYHCNEPGPRASFAGQRDNVHVRSRYGKIEQGADREGRG